MEDFQAWLDPLLYIVGAAMAIMSFLKIIVPAVKKMGVHRQEEYEEHAQTAKDLKTILSLVNQAEENQMKIKETGSVLLENVLYMSAEELINHNDITKKQFDSIESLWKVYQHTNDKLDPFLEKIVYEVKNKPIKG